MPLLFSHTVYKSYPQSFVTKGRWDRLLAWYDSLAAQSLTFRRGYVPGSLCCPSLASLLTGMYPHQHRITSNDPPVGKDGAPGQPR